MKGWEIFGDKKDPDPSIPRTKNLLNLLFCLIPAQTIPDDLLQLIFPTHKKSKSMLKSLQSAWGSTNWCKGWCCWKQGLGFVWPKNCSWMFGFWFGHACNHQLKFKQCPEVPLDPVRPKDTSEVRCGVKSGFPVESNWVEHSTPTICLNPKTFSKNEVWRWCYFTWIKTWRVLCPACLSQNIMFSIKRSHSGNEWLQTPTNAEAM